MYININLLHLRSIDTLLIYISISSHVLTVGTHNAEMPIEIENVAQIIHFIYKGRKFFTFSNLLTCTRISTYTV